jgi:type IX secretion system substrate protein
MKLQLVLFCALLTLQAHGQSYDWINHFGSPGSDFSNNVKMDKDGNTYSAGFYRLGGFEIDGQVLPFVDAMDSYLAKFDTGGALLWAIPFYGKGVFDRTEGLEIDEEGNIYVLSLIQEIQNIGDQITLEIDSLNGFDILLMKFTPDGQLIWHKIFGGPGSDLAYHFLRREDDLLLVGHFRDTLYFDDITLVSTNENQDMFIASLDLEGNPLWARRYGGFGHDRLYEIAEHENGDLAVCGYAAGDWQFGSTVLEARESRYNGFTGRLSSDGEPMWAAQILTQDNSNAGVSSITTDEANNTYVTGALTGLSRIGSDEYDAKGTGLFFIIKYMSSGDIDWVHVADTQNGSDYSGGGIIKYVDDRLWVGGSIGREMQFLGKDFSDLDTTNFYIAIMDDDGNLISDFYDGGAGYAFCGTLEIIGEKILCALFANGDVVLNGVPYSTRDYDIIVAQIDFSDVISSVDSRQVENQPIIFPNPVKDILNIEMTLDAFKEIQVLDNMGRTLIISPVRSQIDVSSLIAGNYYVRFVAEGRTFVLPFLIVR